MKTAFTRWWKKNCEGYPGWEPKLWFVLVAFNAGYRAGKKAKNET